MKFRFSIPSALMILLTTFTMATLSAPSHAAGSGAKLCPLGVNIGMPEFVDAMKSAPAFSPIDKDQKDFALNAQGWPTGDASVFVFDDRINMPWRMTYPDAVNADESGDYHLSFTGQAVVVPGDPGMFTISKQVYHTATNTTTAILTMPKGPANNVLFIKFTGTKGGVQNVKLIRPGYPADTKQIFTTEYLNAIKPFAALRFMDFLSMNNFSHPTNDQQYPMMTEWKDRRLLTDATQNDSGGKHGVAWEYAAELANETGKDMWINIPIAATDDYVTQLAALLKKTVNPKLHIYVEYSNEVWNFGFGQNWWNATAAKAEKIDWPGYRYAKRTVEIGQIFKKVYGPTAMNTTIRPVLMWQEYDFNAILGMLNWIASNDGPPKNYLYAVGNAAYIDADNTSSVDAVLAALERSSEADRKMTEDYVYIAHRFGLKMLAYEGGVGMNGTNDLQNKLGANRDPRIIPLLKHHLVDNWYGAGGDLFMYYSLAGAQSQWGTWGLIGNDLAKPNTPKYRAAVTVTQTPMPPVRVGVSLPTEVGKSVSIDENDFVGSQHKPGTPDQNMWCRPGDRNDFAIDAVVPGTYAIEVQALQEKAGENQQVAIDEKPVVTMPLPAKATVMLAPGLHSLALTAQGHPAMGGGAKIIITRTH